MTRPPEESSSPTPEANVLRYADARTDRLEAIARFPDATGAHLAAGKLQSEGIDAQVGEFQLRPDVFTVWAGVVAVHADDRDEAIRILAATPARRYLLAQDSELPPVRALPVPRCPACGSDQIAPPSRWLVVVGGILMLAPLLLLGTDAIVWFLGFSALWAVLWLKGRPLYCRKCGRRCTPEDVTDEEALSSPKDRRE